MKSRPTYLNRGFTLIELILVVSIIAIVSSFGFVSLNQLVGAKDFETSVDEFVNTVYEAKSNTLSQVKLGGNCTTTNLIGYKISVNTSVDPITYTMSIVCGTDSDTPSSWVTTAIKTLSFPSDTTAEITPLNNFMFETPNALVDEEFTINLTNDSSNRTIVVATAGAILQ